MAYYSLGGRGDRIASNLPRSAQCMSFCHSGWWQFNVTLCLYDDIIFPKKCDKHKSSANGNTEQEIRVAGPYLISGLEKRWGDSGQTLSLHIPSLFFITYLEKTQGPLSSYFPTADRNLCVFRTALLKFYRKKFPSGSWFLLSVGALASSYLVLYQWALVVHLTDSAPGSSFWHPLQVMGKCPKWGNPLWTAVLSSLESEFPESSSSTTNTLVTLLPPEPISRVEEAVLSCSLASSVFPTNQHPSELILLLNTLVFFNYHVYHCGETHMTYKLTLQPLKMYRLVICSYNCHHYTSLERFTSWKLFNSYFLPLRLWLL